jgi:S1-C subfamily serine protease
MIGRGVEIYDFRGSAFEQIGLQEGDTVLEIDGKKIHSLEEMRKPHL